MDVLYTAVATARGARHGAVASDDGRLDLELSRPASMAGDDGPGTNPEQLFAAGWSACFHSAMRLGLRPLGLTATALEGSSVTARISLAREGDAAYQLHAVLEGHLPALDGDTAQRLMELTHQVCPYSVATRGNVPVELRVRTV